jgi:hypothetical protein
MALSRLADRSLRDAWMHFDERMDDLIASGVFQDRQRFISAVDAAHHIGRVPRLMELDTRRIHYVDREGGLGACDLADLRRVVQELQRSVHEWWNRDPVIPE